jgi:hypothetical protein
MEKRERSFANASQDCGPVRPGSQRDSILSNLNDVEDFAGRPRVVPRCPKNPLPNESQRMRRFEVAEKQSALRHPPRRRCADPGSLHHEMGRAIRIEPQRSVARTARLVFDLPQSHEPRIPPRPVPPACDGDHKRQNTGDDASAFAFRFRCFVGHPAENPTGRQPNGELKADGWHAVTPPICLPTSNQDLLRRVGMEFQRNRSRRPSFTLHPPHNPRRIPRGPNTLLHFPPSSMELLRTMLPFVCSRPAAARSIRPNQRDDRPRTSVLRRGELSA